MPRPPSRICGWSSSSQPRIGQLLN
jgi:hypothetical protein